MPKEFSSIEAAVDAMRRGEVIIVLDAEDRENEGDFVFAAEKVTPEAVNFCISHMGRCSTLSFATINIRRQLHRDGKPILPSHTATTTRTSG